MSTIPDAVRRFLDGRAHAVISTVEPDGAPLAVLAWFRRDGDEIVVNSAIGRRWPANLLRDPRASIVVSDDAGSWVRLSGSVRANRDQSVAQADIADLARTIAPNRAETMIATFRTQERVTFRLAPDRIHAEIGEED